MKPSLFVILSFLLLAFTTNLPLALSSPVVGPGQVRDVSGNPIFPGSQLYIKPTPYIMSSGGGVTAAKTGNSTCPVTVLQDFSKADNGSKVRFILPGITPGIIFTGSPVDVYFDEKPAECVSSSKWVVIADDFPGGKWIGVGDSPQDHPGKQIITGTGKFNIRKSEIIGYYIVYCDKFYVQSTCFNITRYQDKNGWRLVLTKGQPYLIEFVDGTVA